MTNRLTPTNIWLVFLSLLLLASAAAAQQAWCGKAGPACQTILEAFKAGKP